MRKFFYATAAFIFLTTTGCTSRNVEVVGKSIQNISKCCSKIKASCSKISFPSIVPETIESSDQITAPLPVYSWDSKMMFY